MKSSEFLIERIVTVRTPAEKARYSQIVWDILQQSYASIGGFKSAEDPSDLIGKTGMWKLVVRGNEVTAVFAYKDANGRKTIAAGQDGSIQGKKDFRMLNSDDVRTGRAWGEVSGAMEALMRKAGAKAIPNQYAHILTGKKIISLNDDGVHYTREIQGTPYEKIIYGVVQADEEMMQKLAQSGIEMHDFPQNIRSK